MGRLRLKDYPLAMDSTCFEQRHRSVHYERRCRQMGEVDKGKTAGGESVNASRRRRLRAMPKQAIAVASSCHLVLAARVRNGNGSDARDFADLLTRSRQRANVQMVVADAGYDSEKNHRIAREGMDVRSIIPAGIGRRQAQRAAARAVVGDVHDEVHWMIGVVGVDPGDHQEAAGRAGRDDARRGVVSNTPTKIDIGRKVTQTRRLLCTNHAQSFCWSQKARPRSRMSRRAVCYCDVQ
jgi:hypothetical protein